MSQPFSGKNIATIPSAQKSTATLTWEITPPEATPGLGAMLRVGARAIPVSQICGFIGSGDRDVDTKPALATLAVFSVAALFFLLGVLDIGWRARFLVAFALFAGIALSALHDMAWLTKTGLYRVEILTASGETVRYTTIDITEQHRLLSALDKAMVRPRPANDDTPADRLPPRRPHVQLLQARA